MQLYTLESNAADVLQPNVSDFYQIGCYRLLRDVYRQTLAIYTYATSCL